jgi:DNA-binding IscR family transcriptional regulator
MFQITRRADYTLRIVQALSIPGPCLHNITGDLVEAGLVRTDSGRTGGQALARPAAENNLKQI